MSSFNTDYMGEEVKSFGLSVNKLIFLATKGTCKIENLTNSTGDWLDLNLVTNFNAVSYAKTQY